MIEGSFERDGLSRELLGARMRGEERRVAEMGARE